MHHPPAPRREQHVAPVRAAAFGGASGDVVTMAAASRLLGIPRRELARQIARGRFVTATLVGGRWTIDSAEVEWHAAQPPEHAEEAPSDRP